MLYFLGCVVTFFLLSDQLIAQTSGGPGTQPAPTRPVIDVSAIDEATCWLYYFQEGPYGALLLAVTGIGALVSCAIGAYKAALNLFAVALGSWMIRPVATILFQYNIVNCSQLMQFPRPPTGG